MSVAIIIVMIIVASVAFHFWSPWWWTPVASNWGGMDDTIILTFWVTGAVFIAVCLFMAYCTWSYRYQKDRKAEYKPEDKKLEFHLTWLTTLGVVVMLAPGLVVWHKYVNVPKEALNVEVLAYQWGWKYRLPGDDGDLHLQINKPVKFLLRSLDVLHNFYVPQFRGKMDMVPGLVTFYWLTPTRTGDFEVLCAEFCGTGHYAMRGRVFVDEEKKYHQWLAQQITFKQMLAQNRIDNKSLKLVKNVE
jgi:cytochrome c oxidase subunit 2